MPCDECRELQVKLAESERLRLCENWQTAEQITRAREAVAEANRLKARLETLEGNTVDVQVRQTLGQRTVPRYPMRSMVGKAGFLLRRR